MVDKRKIFRPLAMDKFFKAYSTNPFLDGRQDVDYYRKMGDKPEIQRIPILNLEQLQSNVGIINVNTSPVGADFFISQNGNEIPMGTTTDQGLTITDIPVGTYNYIIKKTDFQDYKDQITVLEGEVCCIDVDLKSAQKSESCQQIQQPTPTEQQPQPSGFFVSDRDILKGIGILALGLFIGYILFGRKD